MVGAALGSVPFLVITNHSVPCSLPNPTLLPLHPHTVFSASRTDIKPPQPRDATEQVPGTDVSFLIKKPLIKVPFSETSYKNKVANFKVLCTGLEEVKQLSQRGLMARKAVPSQGDGSTTVHGIPSQGRRTISVSQRRFGSEFGCDLNKNHVFLKTGY